MTNLKFEKNERVAVIGKRYNPQLGMYITGPYIGRIARKNKNSFTVKFNDDRDNKYYPTSFNFDGHARHSTNCVYGSIAYEAHTISETIEIIKSTIPEYHPESFAAKKLNNA